MEQTPVLAPMTVVAVTAPKKRNPWLLAPMACVALAVAAPIVGKIPAVASLLGQGTGNQLTIIARADGTFDIKEFAKPDQWFAPDVVGIALKATATRRFGSDIKPESVNILVKSDPGVKADAVRVAVSAARASGFVRFGFADPRLGEIAQQVAVSPAAPIRAAQ